MSLSNGLEAEPFASGCRHELDSFETVRDAIEEANGVGGGDGSRSNAAPVLEYSYW